MSSNQRMNILRQLSRYLGETVTIFTTSGGESGSGFTGVLININCDFVRLLSDIGPAPACALGSCCTKSKRHHCGDDFDDDFDENENNSRINCGLRNVGAVVDIPINRIAAFVHNAI